MWCFNRYHSLKFLFQIICIPLLSCKCHMPHYFLLYFRQQDIGWKVDIMNVPILRYISQHNFLEHHQLIFLHFILLRDQVLRQYTRTEKLGIYVISGFHREIDENCTLLCYFAASNGNSLKTFQEISFPSSK